MKLAHRPNSPTAPLASDSWFFVAGGVSISFVWDERERLQERISVVGLSYSHFKVSGVWGLVLELNHFLRVFFFATLFERTSVAGATVL